MTDRPDTTHQRKPSRRWFQFRLRTLLIGVAILAIPCGFLGWQFKAVRHRAAERQLLEQLGAKFLLMDKDEPVRLGHRSTSRLRIWIGDCDVEAIRLPFLGPPDQLAKDRSEVTRRAELAFPEADIVNSLGFLEYVH